MLAVMINGCKKACRISGNNGAAISCNNTGGVSFVNCKNIDISGITWGPVWK